ncbi:MAG: transglycosylase SLT domain-containing protein [Acidobacteria bacterium]|nr:transglycosylase SLT domain-containing protein [Acidobacteriota bacterium]
MKYLFLLATLFALAPAYYPQTADELQASILSAAEHDRHSDALAALRDLEQKYPQTFTANDFDYLAARISEKSGDMAAASAWFLANIKRGSILRPYALFHLAAIARASGNLMLERTYLDEITAFEPNALVAEAARNRRARSWFESGNFAIAIRDFESLAAGTLLPASKAQDPTAREDQLFLARALMAAGDTAAARDAFTTLITTTANAAQPDDIALAAVRGLDRLDIGPNAPAGTAPKLDDSEHLSRASIYQFNRDFTDARLHYAAIIRDHPESTSVPDAIYQTGRSLAQEANYSEALRWFERVVEQFPEHPVSRDALLQAANAYSRVGKHHEGIRRYQDFIAKYSADDRLDRAYLNIIDILRDQDEETDALKWSAKMQEVFRGKLGEALGTFAEARIHLAKNDWAAALAALDRLLAMPELGGAAVPGGTTRAEVTFLRGYTLEQERNFAAAIETYLSIPDGRNEYYGGRATERLQGLANNEAARAAAESKLASLSIGSKDREVSRQNVQAALRLTVDRAARERLLGVLQSIYATLPGYNSIPKFDLIDLTKPAPAEQPSAAADLHRPIGERLAFLGLYDEAAPEYEASLSAPPSGDLGYTLAVQNMRGDRGYKAVAFAEPLWRSVPADYQIELIPTAQIGLLYPAPYRAAFVKFAVPRNVDPRFLLSIVRQESRYRPDIRSNAAARGMMQFIATTSNKIAVELGRTDFDQDELYDPATAIHFGSQYAAGLFRLFPNQPEAVAGSYNGGEDNIRRWMDRSRSDQADRYVPEIAFSQAKDYVYKVMANYRIYQMFYNNNLSAAR